MHTTHWTWEGEPVNVPWRDEPVTIGKKTQINNFCISSQGNEKQCMTCHAGYGWSDKSFDFAEPTNVDCLACHADAAIYNKGDYGIPPEFVDLLAAAKSVRAPTREECGKCHFDGGGGNGVKHGDLDESLYFPSENLDVHMGKLNFLCTDCHQTTDHVVQGKLLADNYTIDPAEQVACENCHQGTVHSDERITLHTDSVACQTCHVPAMALKDPTKTFWDWSTAGQDLPEDHYTYLKIKGNFEYRKDVLPTYQWFNGNIAYRYLLGDPIDPSKTTDMVVPAGDIDDPTAKIFPFKIHTANQPYDTVNNILIPPRTAGEGGFWTPSTGRRPLFWAPRMPAWTIPASSASPRPRWIIRRRTWCSPRRTPCSAPIATATMAAWTGRPWATTAIRWNGAAATQTKQPTAQPSASSSSRP